jgi:hypothetical protein
MFVAQTLHQLTQDRAAEAFKALDAYIRGSERRKESVHPLVAVLFAIAAQIVGRDQSRAETELQLAAQSQSHPTFAAVARLALVLFHDAPDDEELLRQLQKANAYNGRHHAIVQSLIAYIVHTRFGGKSAYAEILTGHARSSEARESLRDNYPQVVKAIFR